VTGDALVQKGYECFVPMHRDRRKWSDRNKEVLSALFPGYIFCRSSSMANGLIVTTPGVIGFVGISNRPAPIDDAEIDAVRRIVDSDLGYGPSPFIRAGSCVRIDGGPLHGMQGTLVQSKSGHRLAVSIQLLQRSVVVEIEETWVRELFSRGALSAPAAVRDPGLRKPA
jgi:transcription antitermination factor NusG